MRELVATGKGIAVERFPDPPSSERCRSADRTDRMPAMLQNCFRTRPWPTEWRWIPVAAAIVTTLWVCDSARSADDETAIQRELGAVQLIDPRVGRPGSADFGRSGVGGLRPLDASVEDVGPLSHSLRRVDSGLRQPTSFENVYRLPGSSLLARADGALYAVFPQSVYANTQQGQFPLIPAGTVFHIGTPYGSFEDAASPRVLTTGRRHEAGAPRYRVDHRFPLEPLQTSARGSLRITDGNGTAAVNGHAMQPVRPMSGPPSFRPETGEEETLTAPGTLFGDEEYRRARLEELLQRAARRESE